MHNPAGKTILYDGKYARFVRRGNWEYAERANATGIVGILAVTAENKVLLVEQFRPPVNRRVIELPAGLAGDVPGESTESLATAARRELLEETGYEAQEMVFLTHGAASAGITDEVISIFRATGLKRTGPGVGDGGEDITLHEIPLESVHSWLEEKQRLGALLDLKVYTGLYFLMARK